MAKPAKQAKKPQSLEEVMADLEKAYGPDNVKFGDWTVKNIDVIPTGTITLDRAIGIGGVPRGRVTVIYGHESSGKTTLATHIVANAQKQGLVGAIIDAEHAFDISYAENIGVNREKLVLLQPDSGEQAFEMLEKLVETGSVGVIVVDSIAHLVPEKELESGSSEMGGIARLMSAGLRRVMGSVRRNNVALILINQIRMKIGVVYGSPETQPGGKAHKFAASVEIKISKQGVIGDKANPIGIHTKAKITKNKVAPPQKEAEFDIYYGEGIDAAGCLISMGAELGVIKKASSYYTIGDKKYSGLTNASAALKNDPELFSEIYNRVLALAGPAPTVKNDSDFDDEEAADGD